MKEKVHKIKEFCAGGDDEVFCLHICVFIILLLLGPIRMLMTYTPDHIWNLTDTMSWGFIVVYLVGIILFGILRTKTIEGTKLDLKRDEKSLETMEQIWQDNVNKHIEIELEECGKKYRKDYLKEVIKIYSECTKRGVKTESSPDFKLIADNLKMDIEKAKEQFNVGKDLDKKLKERTQERLRKKELEAYYKERDTKIKSLLTKGSMIDEKKGKDCVNKIVFKYGQITQLQYGSVQVSFTLKIPTVKIFNKAGKLYSKIKINMFEENKRIGEGYITNELNANKTYDVVFKMNKKIKDEKNIVFEYEFLELIISE